MTYEEIIDKVSNELGIPVNVVKLAYESYWKYIRECITELPLSKELNEEDFNKLKTNFNIPSLGKLSLTYDRYIGVRKRFKYLNKLRNDSSKES